MESPRIISRIGVCLAFLGCLALTPPVLAAASTERDDERGQHAKPAHIQILTQPTSQTVAIGRRATFTVQAAGKPRRLHYQWRKNGQRVGWDSPSYSILLTTPWHAGTYTVTVSNPTGSVSSIPAQLIVNCPPTIQAQPVHQTVALGTAASLSVSASGSGSLSYAWYKNGRAIPGATESTLGFPAVAATDAGLYSVLVTNTLNGTTTSMPSRLALLRVNIPPTITQQPAGQTLVVGSPASFKVMANVQMGGRLGYQWRKDGVAIPGANLATYGIASVVGSDSGTYDVQVTNTLNGVITTTQSAPAILGINIPPVITAQPEPQNIDLGSSVTFSVTASNAGEGTLSYQWMKEGNAIPGANQSTFTIAGAMATDSGSYQVQVSNTLNGTTTSTTSSAALLKVNVPPSILTQPQTQTVVPPDSVTFTVVATSNNGGTLTYQWKKNGTPILDATSASYTVPSTEFPTNSDAYAVLVSEGGQSTESATVYAIASVPSATYAGDPAPVPSRPLTVLPSAHVDAVAYPNGAFRLGYDETLKNPVWTAYVNFPVNSPYPNSDGDYTKDMRLDAPQVGKDDYTGIYTGGANSPNSYDRGHQIPRADVSYRYTPVAGDDATMMSNLVPQTSQFNQQTWQKLEDAIGGTRGGSTNGLTSFKGRVWVYTGSVFPETLAWWNSRVTPGLRIAIPSACYKIVVHEKAPGNPEVLAVLMPNVWGLTNSTSTLTWYVTSVARIEALTGLDFFPNLATVAPSINIPAWKATVDVRGWRPPFEQASGPNVHMIQPSWDTTIDEGTTLTFEGAATAPTAIDPTATIAGATWTFGDGTPSTTGFTATHAFNSTGTFQVAFTANDSLGTSNTITRVIRVIPPLSNNTAPTMNPAVIADQVTTSGQSVTVNFTVADDRTPAMAIQVTATSDNGVVLPETGIKVTNTSGAVVLMLTPAAGQSGVANITVTLTDSDGSATTRTFMLTVHPEATNTLTEGFESGSKTAYAVGNVTFNSGVWTLADALVGTSDSDRKSGTKSLRVRNGKVTMAFDWPNGAQTVTVNHAKYGSDADSTWELWYSTDGGTNWVIAGPAVVSNSTTLTQATFPVNVPGMIRFEVRKTVGGTTRFNLDDFQIQGF